MPGRSGVELLEEAKGLSPAMRIVLTAYPDASDLMEAINRGEVYRYVTKPWSPEELKIVIAHALEHYQLAVGLALWARGGGGVRARAARAARIDRRRLSQHRPAGDDVREGAVRQGRPLLSYALRRPILSRAARHRRRAPAHHHHRRVCGRRSDGWHGLVGGWSRRHRAARLDRTSRG